MLSDSDSETNDLHNLTINEHYAKAFEYKKEREELAKLKEKYGSDYSGSGSDGGDGSDDSEDTDEDSDGEELTPAMDAAILRTLALIKKKDPAIYEGGRRVFQEEHTRTQDKAPVVMRKTKEKPTKPLTIREAALASALADVDPHSRSSSPEPRRLTHVEEQTLLRSEARAAFHDAVGSEEQGEDDDLLVPRSRTRDEIELEEEEYAAFLEREVGEDLHNLVTVDTNPAIGASEDIEIAKDGDKVQEGKKKKSKKDRKKEKEKPEEKDEENGKKAVKKRSEKSKEEAGQEFLINYIFNRGWIDHSNRRVPTYNEIVGPSSKSSKRKSAESQAGLDRNDSENQKSRDGEGEGEGGTLSDEDAFDDLADAFETSYNFRFEEPDGALIASYPRDAPSARRESTTRKDARARKKERQEAEKQTLLEVRRGEIRAERALVEAAVSGEYPDEMDTSNQKKSKRQKRREELARLKALKAKELRRKLEQVSAEGGLEGVDDEALVHLDLDADWDPSKHDTQMAELYGNEDDNDDDAKKPTWDDDINIDDIVPPADIDSKARLKKLRKKEKKKNKRADKDVGVDVDEMDADLDAGPGWDDEDEEWKGTEEERKRKVDAYMDEVVNRLGFSGITSHMPTRFHYTSTVPENYGLTPAEVLLATDAELNSYVGLKKMAPYRVDKGGKARKSWDPKRAQHLKEFREQLHSRVGSRYEGAWALEGSRISRHGTTEALGEKKKRKGKKERAKQKARQVENDGDDVDDPGVQLDVEKTSEKRKRDMEISLDPHAVPADGEDAEDGPRRKKRRRRHGKGSGAVGSEA